MGFEELPFPLQIFIPIFVLLVVISLCAGICQMFYYPYGHYGYGYGHPAMLMGAAGMGMGGPMIAPSVSMTCKYTT